MNTRTRTPARILGTLAVTALVVGLTACDATAPSRLESERPSPAAASTTPEPSAPEPSTSPAPVPVRVALPSTSYDGWLDAIPDSLDLAAGLPDPDGDVTRDHRPVVGTFCGTAAFPRRDVVDRRSARATGPEWADVRDLRLFTTDRAAARWQRHALRVVRDCPVERQGGTRWRNQLRPSDLGQSAFTALRTYRTAGQQNAAADWWEVTRTGNAVLVAATGGEYLPGPALERARARYHRGVRGLVAGLCVFTPEGCAVGDPDIPAGFPLAAGLPTEGAEGPGAGLAGPSRALATPTWNLCGSTFTLPDVRDRMAAQWSNPEDWRGRQLVTFEDADQARTFLARLVSFYQSCPRQSTGVGFVGFQHVELQQVGEESYALYRVQEYQGSPGLGVDIGQVTRVGRAVLIDGVANEGNAQGVPSQLRRMTRASKDVVAAMCVWTDAGCPADEEPVLGPDGVGGLELGMTAEQARANGAKLTDAGNGTGCSRVRLADGEHLISGDLSPDAGVVMLTVSGGVTPEGIGAATPATTAYAAYPEADAGDGQLFTPGVPGRPGRYYRMEIVEGYVDSLLLVDAAHGCNS